MNALRRWLVVSACVFASQTLVAQVSPWVVGVRIPQATEGHSLSISVDLAQQEQIRQLKLRYRQFGETEFKELEMLVAGRTAVATLPGTAVSPPYIEYYVELQVGADQPATYPTENPIANPLKIQVTPVNPKDMEVRVLSPEEGETVDVEDLAVAISLFYASDNVNRAATKLYLDGIEVTKDAILTDDAILYSPKNFERSLDLGSHRLRVELYDKQGKLYHTVRTSFNLSTALAIEEQKSALQLLGSGQAEYRNEYVDSTTTTYLRGDFQSTGSWKFLNFGANLHLTNEDKPDRQPQNRFLGTLQASEYAKVLFGDAYPMFPSLVMSGKRVRGITGSLTFGFFNLDVSYGQTDRLIEGIETGILTYDTNTVKSRAHNTKFVRQSGDTAFYYMGYNPGVFTRNLLAVRPSFGSGENFQWGFSYMKVKDDMGSISYGVFPKENLVAGTDLLVAFDDQRFKWTTQVALTITNNDISGGNLTDAQIDSVKGVYKGYLDGTKHGADSVQAIADSLKAIKDANDLKSLASTARNFITVNEQLFPANAADPTLPSLGLESEMTLNYFNNFLRAFAFRRGKAFQSFGNEFVQTDIQGFNMSDRFRLLQNRLMLSASYELKSNNVSNDDKAITTTFGTMNSSATVFPGANLPTFTLGYGFLTRKNPIAIVDTFDTDYSDAVKRAGVADEITNRFFLATSYDFTLQVRNSITASVSVANKEDRTFYKRNQENLNVSASLTTNYKIPLQTTIGVIVSSNKNFQNLRTGALIPHDSKVASLYDSTATTQFAYQTISLAGQYRFMNDRLLVNAVIAPSFGDFQRTLIQFGTDFRLSDFHTLTGELDYIQNPGRASDIIGSVIWRFNF